MTILMWPLSTTSEIPDKFGSVMLVTMVQRFDTKIQSNIYEIKRITRSANSNKENLGGKVHVAVD